MTYSIFPKVFKAGASATLKIKMNGAEKCGEVGVKIQPMESYGIEHSPLYRIDEEERYPYYPAEALGDGWYSVEYFFPSEQKYSIRVRMDGAPVWRECYIYAVDSDLMSLRPFKGDTHLHTNRSDGEGTPFEVSIRYRAAGFDFIAITDHHRMYPSVEAIERLAPLTDAFTVIRAEEVHNKDMGYFHVINLGGAHSVNEIIEADDGVAEREVERILGEQTAPEGTAPYVLAYRKFITNEIRRGGGIAVMAHPYWSCFGEYNMQTADTLHLLRTGVYDALEVLAGCDSNGNGNDIQLALWQELLYEGIRIPVLGASDSHSTTKPTSRFNKQFSIAFAPDAGGLLDAIKGGMTVAVERRSEEDFRVIGSLRLTKYARFLMEEYYPSYLPLTAAHADALGREDVPALRDAEAAINRYFADFFGAQH
ncbi:MAG: PHP domain-containing protein [Clostridia bacterium]|nr:PHP domain-containing protein [Clostridia bacterium]